MPAPVAHDDDPSPARLDPRELRLGEVDELARRAHPLHPRGRQAASTAVALLTSAPVWDRAARAPTSPPPTVRSTTGFPASTACCARGRRPVRRGSPRSRGRSRGSARGRSGCGRARPPRGRPGSRATRSARSRARSHRRAGRARARGCRSGRPGRSSRPELAPAEVEARRGVEDPETVRPEEDGARRPNALDNRGLPGPALVARLPEPGRDPDERFRARGERCVDRVLEPVGGNREHDELRRLGQVCERGVGLPLEDFAARSGSRDRPRGFSLPGGRRARDGCPTSQGRWKPRESRRSGD